MVIIKSMINQYLYAMLGRRGLISTWWESPNKHWDGRTPNSVYLTGPEGREEVYQYVLMCAEGGGS